MILLLFSATWVGRQFGSNASSFYTQQISGIALPYLVLGAVSVLAVLFFNQTPKIAIPPRLRSLGLWGWCIGAWAIVVLALSRAIWEGAPELFADWRDIAVLAIVAGIVARFCASAKWRDILLPDFAIAYGLAALIPLADWLSGGGGDLHGVRIPLFYGPVLTFSSWSSLVLSDLLSSGLSRFTARRKVLITIAWVGATLLVLLSFRRTYWFIWGLGITAIIYMRLRDRRTSGARAVGITTVAAAAVIAVFFFLGTENVTGRIASFLPGSDSEFSATNEDHFNDVADAVAAGSDNFFWGIGIGRNYESERTVDWKSSSFEVHNALVHVWIKFGILGALIYAGFHISWAVAAIRNRVPTESGRRTMTITGIFLLADFISSMVNTWPYGSFQTSIYRGLLLGVLIAATPNLSRRTSRVPQHHGRLARLPERETVDQVAPS
jgi:hypothetical protein